MLGLRTTIYKVGNLALAKGNLDPLTGLDKNTVSALNHAGASGGFSYISVAGGAFLEWIEGKSLPGLQVLND